MMIAHDAWWDEAPLPCQALGHDATIVDVNPLWEQLTGYKAEEVLGTDYREMVPLEHREHFEETFRLFAEQGYLQDRLCYIQRKDGEVRTVRIFGRMTQRDGEILSRCMVVDVTEHARTRAALAESEERYRRLFELAPNPIIVHDGRNVVMANEASARFLGFDGVEDLLGLPIADFVHESSRATVGERVVRMLQDDWVAPLQEERFVRRDGTVVTGNTIAAPMVMDGRRLIHVAALDDSERRRYETALEASEHRFQQLFESSVDAIVVHDGARAILANPAAIAAFGLPEGDYAGVDIAPFIHPDSQSVSRDRIGAFLSGVDRMPPIEMHLLRNDGSDWHAEASSSAIEIEGHRVLQTVFRDVSERRRIESERDDYRRRLEKLVEERTQSLERVRAELDSVTAVIGRTVELRDPYTAGHQRRVASLSVAVARKLGMSERDVDDIRVAAALHDIGKISIPAELLSKPGRFSALEFELVKTHAESGYEIIASAELGGPIADMVRQHHERIDGSGYPLGITAAQTLPGSLVLQVADVVEAMASHRPYRPSLGVGVALDEIRAGRGELYDSDVVDACVAVFDEGFEFSE